MDTRSFWPLDFDPEDEIYENVAWDLPGYRRCPRRSSRYGSGESLHSAPVRLADSAKSRVQSP